MKKQPKKIYFVRYYGTDDLSLLPDSRTPYSSLAAAKMGVAFEISQMEMPVRFSGSNLKASDFSNHSEEAVAQDTYLGATSFPTITVSMTNDPEIISEWWDEEAGEFKYD